jgi:hypothetical protein
MTTKFELHQVPAIYPVADAFAGTNATDIIKMPGEGILFTRFDGAGATGTDTVTVLACDDVSASNTHAVAFKYRVSTTPDVWGDWTEATTTGFATTAGANQMYQIWVAAEELAHIGYAYVKVVFTELVNSEVTGCVIATLIGARYSEQPESLIV